MRDRVQILICKKVSKKRFEKRKPPQELMRSKLGKPLDRRKLRDIVDEEVAIDRTKLDFENAKQPRLFEKYNKKYIRAYRRYLEAEQVFNGKKARMAGDVRKNPEQWGIIGKVTESAIQLALPNHKDFRAAHLEYLDILEEYHYLKNVLDNIGKRTHPLSNLTRLIEVGYYTSTSMTQEEYNPYDEKEDF